MSDSRPGWQAAQRQAASELAVHRFHAEWRLRDDDPGWHGCSCGWEGYWIDWQPHVAERVIAAVYGPLVEALTTQLTEQLTRLETPPGRSSGDTYSRGYVAGVRSVRNGLRLAAGLATPKETRDGS